VCAFLLTEEESEYRIATLCCKSIDDFYLITKMEKQHHLIHLAYMRICIHIMLP